MMDDSLDSTPSPPTDQEAELVKPKKTKFFQATSPSLVMALLPKFLIFNSEEPYHTCMLLPTHPSEHAAPPKSCYFEVRVESNIEKDAMVGFVSKESFPLCDPRPLCALSRVGVGDVVASFGVSCGVSFYYDGKSKFISFDKWKLGDVVGCGWNAVTRTLHYWLNGAPVGEPLPMSLKIREACPTLFPCVSLSMSQAVTVRCMEEFSTPAGFAPFRFSAVRLAASQYQSPLHTTMATCSVDQPCEFYPTSLHMCCAQKKCSCHDPEVWDKLDLPVDPPPDDAALSIKPSLSPSAHRRAKAAAEFTQDVLEPRTTRPLSLSTSDMRFSSGPLRGSEGCLTSALADQTALEFHSLTISSGVDDYPWADPTVLCTRTPPPSTRTHHVARGLARIEERKKKLPQYTALKQLATHRTELRAFPLHYTVMKDACGMLPLHVGILYGHLPKVASLLSTHTLLCEPGMILFALKLLVVVTRAASPLAFTIFRALWGNALQHYFHKTKPANPECLDLLRIACEHGCPGVVREMCATWPALAVAPHPYGMGKSALHFAAERGSLEVILALHELGTPMVDLVDKSGATAALMAAREGHFDCLEWFLTHTHPIPRDYGGNSALYMAAREGRADCVRALLAAGYNHSEMNDRNEAPLHVACGRGQVEVVKLLCAAGADVNLPGRDGNSALHYACTGNYSELVKFLISQGADVKMRNIVRDQPIHIAALKGSLECLRLLLFMGANVNVEGCRLNTPLHCAMMGANLQCCQWLHQQGANLRSVDTNRIDCLKWACSTGSVECLRWILAADHRDPRKLDPCDGTCHRSADRPRECVCYWLECFEILVREGDLDCLELMADNIVTVYFENPVGRRKFSNMTLDLVSNAPEPLLVAASQHESTRVAHWLMRRFFKYWSCEELKFSSQNGWYHPVQEFIGRYEDRCWSGIACMTLLLIWKFRMDSKVAQLPLELIHMITRFVLGEKEPLALSDIITDYITVPMGDMVDVLLRRQHERSLNRERAGPPELEERKTS